VNLKAAVIGVGHLGQHHARIYAEMEDVDLIAVVDRDEERARAQSLRHGTQYRTDYEGLDKEVDLVSVATPTIAHFEVVSHFLREGVSVLVEKPMTATIEEARELTALAESGKACLQVGHVERFHPVLQAVEKDQLRPRFIESHRLAPFSFRSADIGVVLDLMIHDLDIVLHLIRSPLRSVHAVGGSLLSPSEDIASARLEFEDGAVANLTASRTSLKTLRRMRLFSRDFYLSLDFDKKYAFRAVKTEEFEQKLADKWDLLSKAAPEQLAVMAAGAFHDLIEVHELDLDDREPLKAELASFVEAVRTQGVPVVPATAALAAMEAAHQIHIEIKKRDW
jgi:predicted dehydrogenase